MTDKDAATYAKTPDEAYDRWRKRIKYDLLLLKAEKADSKTDKSEGKTPEQRLESAITALPSACSRPTPRNCWKCTSPA